MLPINTKIVYHFNNIEDDLLKFLSNLVQSRQINENKILSYKRAKSFYN